MLNVQNVIDCHPMVKKFEFLQNHDVLNFVFWSFEFVSYFEVHPILQHHNFLGSSLPRLVLNSIVK